MNARRKRGGRIVFLALTAAIIIFAVAGFSIATAEQIATVVVAAVVVIGAVAITVFVILRAVTEPLIDEAYGPRVVKPEEDGFLFQTIRCVNCGAVFDYALGVGKKTIYRSTSNDKNGQGKEDKDAKGRKVQRQPQG